MAARQDRWSVGPWMTPAPQTAAPETSTQQAYTQMNDGGFRHLLVVEDGQLVGIISDRDLHTPQVAEAQGAPETVGAVMSTDLKVVSPDDGLEKALKLMIFHKISALPVLDTSSQLVGILSTQDVMSAFAATLDDYGPALRQSEES